MSDETTKRIGDYEILKELGAGGMGKVYQVRNVITDRIEAMKVLLPDLAATPGSGGALSARGQAHGQPGPSQYLRRFEPHSRATTSCTW